MSVGWRWSDIDLFTLSESDVTSWFRNAVETKDLFNYESTASNLVAQNPNYIASDVVRVWREQDLGTYENRAGEDARVDVIIECKEVVWIIEVKYPVEYTVIFSEGAWEGCGVGEKLHAYRKRIGELGWWKSKELKLAAVWVYGNNIRDRKEIAESHKLLDRTSS
jgi:hypothetical protein